VRDMRQYSKKNMFLSLTIFACWLCLLPIQKVNAASQIMVNNTTSYDSLDTALRMAPPGATISVPSGHYYGNFVITKPVKLIGTGNPVLDAKGKDTVVSIQSSNVTVEGFTMMHSGSTLGNSPAGVRIDSVKNVTVDNNVFSDVEYGVYVAGASNCRIDNNKINGGKTNLLPEDRGDGMRLWHSDHIFVSNNEIHNTRDGMEFEFSSYNRVSGNTFEDLRYGLHYMYSNYNEFDGNEFANDVAGAVPMYSGYITFSHNIFMHMLDYRAYGVLLKQCHDSKITDNLIMDNTVGVFMDGSYNNVISNNYIVNNGIGLRVLGNSYSNTFYENDLMNNITQVGKISQGMPNNWSFQGKGNYWSDYVGYDSAGHGTGSSPYESKDYFASLVSQFPILLQFSSSPALSALKNADNQFPLAQIAGIEDEHPLTQPIPVSAEWAPYLTEASSTWPGTVLLSSICVLVGSYLMMRANRRKRRKRSWFSMRKMSAYKFKSERS
jgi:nitrous oxidase accessory protein